MTLFNDKYRIESTRLPGWDYSAAGYYFVTYCTYGRIPCLGQVVDGDVLLSPTGEIVAEEWLVTEQIRPNVRLDEWIIMPNHVHGIIAITHPVETGRRPVFPPVFPPANEENSADNRTGETGQGSEEETGRPEKTGQRSEKETGQRPEEKKTGR